MAEGSYEVADKGGDGGVWIVKVGFRTPGDGEEVMYEALAGASEAKHDA